MSHNVLEINDNKLLPLSDQITGNCNWKCDLKKKRRNIEINIENINLIFITPHDPHAYNYKYHSIMFRALCRVFVRVYCGCHDTC